MKYTLALGLLAMLVACMPRPVTVGALPPQAECLAILPFEVRFDTEFSEELLSEYLYLELKKHGARVIGPSEVRAAFKKKGQTLPPAIDDYWAQRIGELIGVDMVLFGQLSRAHLTLETLSPSGASVGGTHYTSQKDTHIHASVELYAQWISQQELRWTFASHEVLKPIDYNTWLLDQSQEVVRLLQSPGLYRQTSRVCGEGEAPPEVALPAIPERQSVETPTVAPQVKALTVAQDKIRRSLKKGWNVTHEAFDGRTATLSMQSSRLLDDVIAVLEYDTGIRLWIVGHVDATSDTAGDLELSRQRALAVQKYLQSKGIELTRIEYLGEGGTQPIAPNLFERSRELNRRVELRQRVP